METCHPTGFSLCDTHFDCIYHRHYPDPAIVSEEGQHKMIDGMTSKGKQNIIDEDFKSRAILFF